MAEPLSSLIRAHSAPSLPIFERLAPAPSESLIAAELAARTSPGDIVVDLHGRGAWVARAGIGALRRVYDLESSGLTRLLADVVLRPPDLRHFDAAVSTLAAHPRGNTGLRDSLNEAFASTCPTCGRQVVVDEFIWDGASPAPARKVFRCAFCRDQARGQDQRSLPVDRADVERWNSLDPQPKARSSLRMRFPIPSVEHPLADELLDLYTPRSLVAIEALIARMEQDLRSAPITAALRLALAGALLPASKLHSYPGRVAALRIQQGHMRPLGDRQWRERNPWLVFEEQCRLVRGLIARMAASAATFQPRQGEDLDALLDGTANVVLRTGSAETPRNTPAFSALRPQFPGRFDPRSRLTLVLTQPPVRWTTENLSFAYFTTALVLGRDEANNLPIDGIFGPPPRSAWGREATAMRRSLLAVKPVLAVDADAVVMLDRTGPSGLVAAVLGGVGAGFRLSSAVLTEVDDEIEGLLELTLREPGPAEGAPADLERLARPVPNEPFQLSAVEQAVSDVAVAVLQARGEPARFERLLGEVLIGLDRLGHLRRLVGTQTFTETEARVDDPPGQTLPGIATADGNGVSTADSAGEATEKQPVAGDLAWLFRPPAAVETADSDAAAQVAVDIEEDVEEDVEEEAAAPPSWAIGARSATDHVRLFMEIVMAELRRPDNPRLTELEPGRWWLRAADDIAKCRQPLSDRMEWAIFGLLSTADGLSEDTFFDRVARMFRGFDTPDEEMVRAILDSYRDPAAPADALRTADDLPGRHLEHGQMVGLLIEYGHRLGLRCWAAPREQRRRFRDGTVGDLLSEEERRAYLPLVVTGDPAAIESIDCVWYVRGKATFLFEVEWTALLTEPLLARGRRIPTDDTLVRFLVLPDERIELARLKLARSPLLRGAMEEDNWHILKWEHVRRLPAQEEASLEQLAPLIGLDPDIERQAEQLALFG